MITILSAKSSSKKLVKVMLALAFGPSRRYREVSQGSLPVKAEAECLSYRIEKLPRGQPVGCAFQSWMGDGFPIHRGEIYHAINRLRKLKMYKRALEMMEWVIRERPYRPKELEYSYLLEFTTRFHGMSRAAGK
ncbi:pentatricopeptide repeat-containing protein At1g07590, mitochondrial-like [Eucalyptus grandis]|uniref:pentatricopeptide repeat-containing protein At1g07590, mitochondrial-like n=1 Tax=Eucalyptus grandis TaxID=71139 RepID=UPI00192EAC63|nr:pentatricopeptide repeat-containing protein At1g07590, mitochondrial-like [Eucalyptus grandis]